MACTGKTKTSTFRKAPTALTTAYAGWAADVDTGELTRVALLFSYVYDSASSVELQIAYSDNGADYYTLQKAASGTLSDNSQSKSVSDDASFAVELDVSFARYVRVSAKRTDGSSSDTLALDVIGGGHA